MVSLSAVSSAQSYAGRAERYERWREVAYELGVVADDGNRVIIAQPAIHQGIVQFPRVRRQTPRTASRWTAPPRGGD